MVNSLRKKVLRFQVNLSGIFLNPEERSRFVTPREMLSSHVLPVTSEQAAACMAPKLNLADVPPLQIAKMAGNSMNVQCVAAVLLTAILALDYK